MEYLFTNHKRSPPEAPPLRPQPANRCEGLTALYFPEGLAARRDLSRAQRLGSGRGGSCESVSDAVRACASVTPEPSRRPTSSRLSPWSPASTGACLWIRRLSVGTPLSVRPRPARTPSAPPSPGRDGAHHPDPGPAGRWPQVGVLSPAVSFCFVSCKLGTRPRGAVYEVTDSLGAARDVALRSP